MKTGDKVKRCRITKTERGFHNYGRPVHCTYGTEVWVRESSSADGPHVWMFLKEDRSVLPSTPPGEAACHLNASQAREVIRRLQTWLDVIPSRWKR